MVEIPTHTHADNPVGAPFVIEQVSFKPNESFNFAMVDLEEDKLVNWPMVYILANANSAYVGQTTSVVTRMSQHGANEEKRDFTTANIIYNSEFNASVITDYEHRLIGLMHADGKYRLTNKNDGMTDTNYFSKAAYNEMFEDLWENLRQFELADHTISEIEETEVFKYSPFKGLNANQRVALDKIMCAIKDGLENAHPIVVEGMPGTGKTVLAIYLLKMLKDTPEYKNLNIRIVEPVTALRETLRNSLKNVNGLSKNDIISPTDLVKTEMGFAGANKKSFDILLIDESHKLKQRVNLGTQFANHDKTCAKLGFSREATQVDWILAQAKLPIFFYDPLQSIGPSCLNRAHLEEALGDALSHPIRLETQMRVKGGEGYLEYIQAILNSNCESFETFEGYDFVLHESIEDFVSSFEETYTSHDLSRIVAGYAWEWKTKKNPDAFDIEIGEVALKWNGSYQNWVGKGVEDPAIAHEVGCIHSIQGYDLSYAYVLIGNDLQIDEETGELISNKANYFDKNGKNTATKDDLDQYIKNIYYVLLTRGIQGTHVYAVDPKVQKYLRNYIATS